MLKTLLFFFDLFILHTTCPWIVFKTISASLRKGQTTQELILIAHRGLSWKTLGETLYLSTAGPGMSWKIR